MHTSTTTIIYFFPCSLNCLDIHTSDLSISLQPDSTSQLSNKYTFWSPFSALGVLKLPAYLTSGTRRESVAVTALGLNGTSAPGGAINVAETPGLDSEKPRVGPTSPRLIQSNLSLFRSHSPSPLSWCVSGVKKGPSRLVGRTLTDQTKPNQTKPDQTQPEPNPTRPTRTHSCFPPPPTPY
ncbi:uncharacterized protein BO88DRAFT_123520 [Aspergillus vadensis CBS 113365]|uniref:Uncharacterized protein n=1 Tax=Aspergillus vadensis (strain CBS 113365 / IMI 142717 / IBT 24658) TaxID=1448311 RepID=A0A319B0T8_ASPVC|nr:hypothetical protein BO88DRAFT_123520 [Aspergillus vadensis CBS 113365]PYH66099.1 hypothetical protein BO88DRAFT_123520 [Aspergillus vadensis CBS 113365]